ncbi:2-oxo-4-hydroxy-4-carboxy-5-ureidoimidazoline decarboxylase [Hymenobacter qilianensis]|uniref:2-oxo-4-hydroxy-4-carboxy-5-ureidoimidazoline decarboxylase n=2 Tax=Hymenobacter qilianensis TaxID=1385715 RepID=A0ACB5PTJ6_9BACT|nr:2-oxo-4-hydroxy-4-carboxy-5-ureidoimidazoline decarboxylase [Hymenobacter qilianensis]QNP52773.1 2-oxo-4-hydroxy-4-carboxy-5-ureidoimidazoline decarboxylase [Hymenobacter qilianensis]GGF70546.1 2-oxo-4-hydroxy-4-carboxy-5-ureidoimidazoline decarboxylase [Hymenobacter qilianensis]
MTLVELNTLPKPALTDALRKCCGSTAWVEAMSQIFPLPDKQTLFAQAATIWRGLSEQDWREAFTHHPKIGDINSLKEKFASTSTWAAGEQAAVQHSSQAVLEALAEGNTRYEEKFGYIFIVCATGKSAEEMLALLQARLPNEPDQEMKIAMGEQAKITQIRLEKLLAV